MDRKALAILMILMTGAALLALGCSGRRNDIAPAGTPLATPAATAIAAGSASNSTGLDPSLADITGEGIDEGGFPEDALPTPVVD